MTDEQKKLVEDVKRRAVRLAQDAEQREAFLREAIRIGGPENVNHMLGLLMNPHTAGEIRKFDDGDLLRIFQFAKTAFCRAMVSYMECQVARAEAGEVDGD